MPESPSHAVHHGSRTSAAGPTAPAAGASPGGEGRDTTPASAPGRRRVRGQTSSRDGGRHGRGQQQPTAAEAAVRRRLLWLTVGPALAVAVLGAVAVALALRLGSGAALPGGPWLLPGGALLLCCGVMAGAALLASTEARSTVDRYTTLRRAATRNQSELQALLRRLERGERPRRPSHGPLPEPAADDAFGLLARDLTVNQRAAEAAVLEAAALVRSSASGSEEKVEVFVNLARRLQSLVHREIELLDELENEVEDPDLLKGLFHVDHLATRIRRHAENLAVLGGAVSRRQWTRPVSMTEVLRSAIAEVEQYPRIKLVPPIEGDLRGHAVADVIHLLAELIENASLFSAPQTQVLLRAQYVTAGLAVEVEDRGLGMTTAEQTRMNTLLTDPERVDVGELLQDGRIGLFVVSQLARRHGIVVQLQSNIYGGVQAVLVVPRALLGEQPEQREQGELRELRETAEVGAAADVHAVEPERHLAGPERHPGIRLPAQPSTTPDRLERRPLRPVPD
ncbi:sensor histidine kinase, partial [Streptomyces durbertensis]|uniref:sensor histidine kinase n=1 Tax=Streptomyces durbertensis TaxID=2448886 RepID=UPI001E5763B8